MKKIYYPGIGWRWLAIMVTAQLWACAVTNWFVLELHRRHEQLEHADGIALVGGWFQ